MFKPDTLPLRVGVDVGGTFTDLVAFDGRMLHVVKVPSTPPRFEIGVANALAGFTAQPIHLIHGSTVATNALLERKLARVGLITTAGFEDILRIGRQSRPDLYALHVRRSQPVVARELCFGVGGRLDPDGGEVEPLDEEAIVAAGLALRKADVSIAAVCLLFSFADARHERRVGEILKSHDIEAILSSEVAPEFREYERASTTSITASLRPIVGDYLGRLREAVPQHVRSIRIVHGGGGTLTPDDAERAAGRLILSGPAGGAAGAALVAQAAGYADAVALDMGGTSTDVSLIRNGHVATRAQHTFDGLPVHLPMLDIHTVGAGGGSIAEVDSGGALRVGPRSAGAMPGPACYGHGGIEPTVTDANVILGRLPAGASLGAVGLDFDRAAEAFDVLAHQINCSGAKAAMGVLQVADQTMAAAVRVVTAGRGYDPRQAVLVGYGGAGGLHACNVAQLLGMTRVLLPPLAGVLSALGMVAAADSADSSRTVLQLDRSGLLDDDRLYAEFGRLNAKLLDAVSPADLAAVECFADCRWQGQSHELTVLAARPTRKAIEAAFVRAYIDRYGESAAPRDREMEIVTLRLRRMGTSQRIELPKIEPDRVPPMSIRLTTSDGRIEIPHYTRRQLVAAKEASGPFILSDVDCTAHVPAGWRATADAHGSVVCQH